MPHYDDEPTPSCGACRHRHEVRKGLECRFMPPRQDVGQFAVYPVVRATDFCHAGFRPDRSEEAEFERARAAADFLERLDTVTAPLLDQSGAPVDPPVGDLAADIAAPQSLTPSVVVGTEAPNAAQDAYPHLTPAQEAALDRTPDDGVTTPGGAPEGGNRKRKAGPAS